MRIKLIVLVSAFAFHVRRLFCVTVAAGRAVLGAGAAEESFELKDGDRVLFIGDTFFEREVDYGHIENNIAKRTVGTLSLMPSGVAENLTEAEQLDLFAFLS